MIASAGAVVLLRVYRAKGRANPHCSHSAGPGACINYARARMPADLSRRKSSAAALVAVATVPLRQTRPLFSSTVFVSATHNAPFIRPMIHSLREILVLRKRLRLEFLYMLALAQFQLSNSSSPLNLVFGCQFTSTKL
jgi:hypothetical protein